MTDINIDDHAITLNQAKQEVIVWMDAGRVPFVKSSPGMGKSSMILSIAKEYNLEPLHEHMSAYDPVAVNGLLGFNTDKTKAMFVPMETFPLEGDPIPKGKNGWLLFLDELPNAAPAVQTALYRLILERKVGRSNLHPQVAIVCAGNRMKDRTGVNKIVTALQSRLIHFNLRSDLEEFTKFATQAKFDHRVLAFLQHKPELLNNFDPKSNEKSFSCERTWEFISDYCKKVGDISYTNLPSIVGTIGQSAGMEFCSFCQIYKELVTPEQILANPQGTPIPEEPVQQWAIAGSIGSHMNKSNLTSFMMYVSRMPLPFQVLCLRIFLSRITDKTEKQHIIATPEIDKWIAMNSKYL